MEKIGLRYNTDFELSLFDKNYNPNTPKSIAMVQELEYLLFWVETGKPVNSKKYYSPEYLDYILSQTGHRPEIIFREKYKNYVNEINDININKLLSSKLTFYKFIEENNIQQAHFQIIQSLKEVDPKKINYPVVVKNPFLFSGIGNIKASNYLEFESNRKKIERWLEQGQVIVESFFNKTKDLGILFEGEEIYIYENIIGKQFQYQGSKSFNIRFPQLIDKAKLIYQYYKDLGLTGVCSIDVMINSDNEFHFHELNPRKSMGYIFKKLNEKFNHKNLESSFLLYPSKKLKYFSAFSDLIKALPDGVKLLSPLSTNAFVSFFITCEASKSISKIKLELEDTILKN